MEAPYRPPFTTIPATETGSGTADHWTAHHGYFNTEIHPPNPSLSRFPCTKFHNPDAPADGSSEKDSTGVRWWTY